ncbi:MAG: RNA polymerase subunit sigma, partial [Chitinophagaceae bacterium]|nr:RNA polymerase subunit sigma [Chitinophagaceae bacterium]
QSILQSLAEQARIVRLPLNKVGLTNRIQKAYSQLEQQFEREPTAEELADLLEMDLEEIKTTLATHSRHVSMDSPLSEGEENTLIDVLENTNAKKTDEELTHKESLKKEIDRSLKTLTERQREVICYFFGIGVDHPLSLEDIGERYCLTRERVRQIKDKAISKLKASNQCQMLKTYLGT